MGIMHRDGGARGGLFGGWRKEKIKDHVKFQTFTTQWIYVD